MTNNWPDKPGFPPEPGKWSAHLIKSHPDRRPSPMLWSVSGQCWISLNGRCWKPEFAGNNWEYCGNLDPDVYAKGWQAGRDQAVAWLIGKHYAKTSGNSYKEAAEAIQSLPPPSRGLGVGYE